MDKIVLTLDDLMVDSYATTAESSVIGDQHTGCIGPCEDRFTEGYYC
ncbi:MAG TPA: hypothetical protein VGC13_08630 [Longimicrobium sp.]|jgi:hypothetical protein